MQVVLSMKKDLSSLFYDPWGDVKDSPFFLYIIIGPRGSGKTYGMLKATVTDKLKFMYVRRTESELKNCCTPSNNPYKSINTDCNYDVRLFSEGDSYKLMECSHEEPEFLGLAGALTTFGKFRGSDFSDIDYIIMDEFINTAPRNSIKPAVEMDLFFNMVETVNRNREILGKKSIKIVLLGNSNGISSSGILTGLRLGEVLRQMQLNNESLYVDAARGIFLRRVEVPELKEKKKETNLYKLCKGTPYYDMAIENSFSSENFNLVKKYKQNQLEPICRYNTISFYTVKGSDIMYCNYIKNDSPLFTEDTHKVFMRSWGITIAYYMETMKMRYYDYDLKILVENIFK